MVKGERESTETGGGLCDSASSLQTSSHDSPEERHTCSRRSRGEVPVRRLAGARRRKAEGMRPPMAADLAIQEAARTPHDA